MQCDRCQHSGVTPRAPDGRAAYHHGQLRAALVATATELARAGGPDAVVLREAARRVSVSPTAAYRHFQDREDLLLAVREAALRGLAQSMRDQDDGTSRRSEAAADAALLHFRALGQGYVAFALAEPGLFRTISVLPTGRQPPPLPAPEHDPLALLARALDRLVDVGVLDQTQRAHADAVAWSAVHGLSMLLLDGLLPDENAGQFPPADADVLIARVLDVVAFGLLPRP